MRVRHHTYRVAYSLTHALGVATAWLAKGYREGTLVERILIVPIWVPFRLAFNAGFIATAVLAGETGRRVRPRDWL
jgi:hypothetical protein